MTLNGEMALILRYFTEFVYDVVVKNSRSLMSFLYIQVPVKMADEQIVLCDAVFCDYFARHEW